MRRVAGALVVGLAAAVMAVAGPAAAEKVVPATKVMPYLDKFLRVPPTERSRMKLSYAVLRDGKRMPNLKAALVEPGGARTPLPLSDDGVFERLPTLAQLEKGANIAFDVPADQKLGSAMDIAPQLKPAGEYDVRDLAATVDEANAVIGRTAGVMAFMAPKLSGIAFPKAEGGMVMFADGRAQPLPLIRSGPYFRPADFKGAVRVKLTKTPSTVAFYSGKK
jgi:hypothetical protein